MAKKKRSSRRIEFDILKKAIIAIVILMFVFHPIMNSISSTYGSFIAYSIYLLLIGIGGYYIGNFFKRGLESLILFIVTFIMIDLLEPPIIIPFAQEPSTELLKIWSSDTFVYSIAQMLGFPHTLSWIFTYIFVPLLGILLLLYYLSGKQLKKQLGGIVKTP